MQAVKNRESNENRKQVRRDERRRAANGRDMTRHGDGEGQL